MGYQIATLETNIVQPPYEPKRCNRFLITFPEELNIPNYVVKTTGRPSCHFGDDESIKWNIMSFTFYDPISPSISQSLMENIRTKKIFETITCVLEMVDPVGTVVEKWKIEGKFLFFDFGELDYQSDDLIKIHADFKVLNVIYDF